MSMPVSLISRACATLLGSPARTAERLKEGSRTVVYRAGLRDGRSVIVKLYAHTARRNALTEATAIHAAAAAVPVPAVLGSGVICDDGATALITCDLGRRTLGSAVRAGRVPRARALGDLGSLLARLHRLPVDPAIPHLPFSASLASLARRCPPKMLSRITPALVVLTGSTARAPTVWCHGDLHFDNVVLHGPRRARYLVDFTDAAPGQPEADVAHAFVMTAAHEPWDRRAFLDSYPLALDHARLSAWVVLHTVRCWAHAAPGKQRRLWSNRLTDLIRRHPHLFRTPRKGRTLR
jgi:aminoglycoside phosphotransferase (APT) family kinase protein